MQIIASPQLRRTDPAIISLLNEISELTDDLVLVLDDYHVIEAEQVHEDLGYLLAYDTFFERFAGSHQFILDYLTEEVLQALLERDHPGELEALHLKAAAWFEREGYPGEAVDHALGSGDVVQARELVLKHWLPVLHRGAGSFLKLDLTTRTTSCIMILETHSLKIMT